MNARQTDKRVSLSVLCVFAAGLNACIRTVEAQTPPDAATAHDAGSHDAHAPHTTVHRQPASLGDGNGGLGFRFGEAPPPQCISEATAHTQSLDSARQGPPGSGGGGGSIIGLSPTARPERPPIGRCPSFIWTWVGAGHGAEPVGSVQAPIVLPATRAARRRTPDACCYLIPSSPGSPLG